MLGEEFGFIGIGLVLLCFAIVLWRVLLIAERSEDAFASTIVFGIFCLWFAHLVANVGMTVGLLPITGLPLPLLSYGGSILLASFVMLAIIQRVSADTRMGA